MWEAPPFSKLQEAIASPSNPIGMRMRAAYFLRQSYDNTMKNKSISTDDSNDHNNNDCLAETVIETLGSGLSNKEHGSLLRHEFAYVMGQLRDERCCPILEETLADNNDCIMVRHECAEALGAIGAERSIPILKQTMNENPNIPELHQTCDIAIEHMQWRISKSDTHEEEPMACACMLSPYNSIDPAPPHPNHISLTTQQISHILNNHDLPLFERYRAMFSLRNRGGAEAVVALGHVLVNDTTSALLRHEIAYVLGQMQHPNSIEALGESLRRSNEHEMVRHEAAEALGAIDAGDRWMDCEAILNEFLLDCDVVVRESCQVALDAADYWGQQQQQQQQQQYPPDNNDDESQNISHTLDMDMNKENASFGKQKAVTNGRTKDALLHHFNVQTS